MRQQSNVANGNYSDMTSPALHEVSKTLTRSLHMD